MEREIGQDFSILFRFSLPDEGGPIAGGSIQVSIQAVVTNIGVTAFEPLMKNFSLTNIEIVI